MFLLLNVYGFAPRPQAGTSKTGEPRGEFRTTQPRILQDINCQIKGWASVTSDCLTVGENAQLVRPYGPLFLSKDTAEPLQKEKGRVVSPQFARRRNPAPNAGKIPSICAAIITIKIMFGSVIAFENAEPFPKSEASKCARCAW